MDEEQAEPARTRHINGAGPVGATVQQNVSLWRIRRKLSQTQLADRVTACGRRMTRQALSDIETGRRRVDVDDLVALALALDVSPATLMMPDVRRAYTEVELTEAPTVRPERIAAASAWAWFTARGPAWDDRTETDVEEFQEDAEPYWAEDARLHPETAHRGVEPGEPAV
ncbi:MAG: helix-turn-helix transcriptional regulator [Gordonia sp. (in: high G+C Gram-positive bacteria)]|uniref:helix-turn-helix domain-containing protein n=1 Tax=Gordonia sp. (in: high G+C Gram-positive bacteria) TaxID=84139 RepID=UPI0039E5AB61